MRGRWHSEGRICLQWQRFASMCLVIYLFVCSATDMYPPHLLLIWYAALCRKWWIQESLRTTLPSLCCGSTLTWRRLGLEGTTLSFPIHNTFGCFWGKPWCESWSGRGYAIVWPVGVKLWTVTLVSDNKLFQRKETCQKTNSALGTWCGSRKTYLLDGIKRLE